MQIQSLHLRGVTRHARTSLDLPETGVVLITGANGSGKSSLIECVPLTVWGKTLRRAPLWNAELVELKNCSAAVRVDGRLLRRTAKSRVKVTWEGAPKHESTRDAQIEIDSKFGDFDQWRRACLLSSQDAANFTAATDAERKRMIEALTGAGKLEAGYRAALADFRVAEAAVVQMRADLSIVRERVKGVRQRLADAVPPDTTLAEPEHPVGHPPVGVLQAHAATAAREQRETVAAIRRVEGTGKAAAATAMDARRQRDRLAAADCPTCGQGIPPDMRAGLENAVAAAEAGAKDEKERIADEVAALEVDLADLRQEHADLTTAAQESALAGRAHEEWGRESARRAQLDALRSAATKDLVESKQLQAATEVSLDAAVARVTTMAAVVRTLGTKGVRAHLLGRTISAIEAAANAWLGRICHGSLRLHLRPYGATKAGGVKDAVSLTIETDRATVATAMLEDEEDALSEAEAMAGAFGRGYESASGGERRRVDVAIMFALAQVAEAARGERHSTIFCDEIFDALDADGVARVCAAVRELASDRAVVVVAHQAAEALRSVATQHWRVTRGKLERV